MSFGENLIAIRKSKGMTRKELADQLDIPYTTLRNYETNQREPGHKTLIDLAKLFSVSVDELIGLKSLTQKQKNAVPKIDTANSIANRYKQLDEHGKLIVCAVISEEERRMQTVQATTDEGKIIHIHWNNQPASAGKGFDLSDEHMEDWMVQYNELTRKADFCLNVQGKSMEPKFQDSDIVLIRQQPAIDVGEIGLFVVDGKGYIKKQGADRLISLNPDYDDIYPNEFSDVRCAGKVIGVLDPEWIISQ